MSKIIRTLNLNRETTSILQNAYAISYEKVSNQIWSASFSLPINDPKVDKVKLLRYVEIDDVGLFRIIPKLTSKNNSSVTFECEHVLATLLDSSLFQYHQLTNYTTKAVLQYLIDRQKVKHFKLGQVDYIRYFHYSWENANLATAIFSVPKTFDEQYRWTWDTSSYPWTLDLVRPETEPTGRIKEGYNLVGFEIEENPMGVFNRIYPLGAGEGVNQLTIKSINKGIPYIEDAASIAKYGLKEYIWPDKRFTDVASLKASTEALIKKWKEPIVTWKVSAADVSSITGLKIDELKEGNVIRLQLDDYPVTDLRIMKESKSDMTGNPGDVQLEIGNLIEDLSTTNADLERRQQINELYSQGATNILNFTYQDNCDDEIPAVIPFYVDDDVVNINTVELTFRTRKFRAYSQATKGGGALVKSTGGGGGTVKSTSGGGGTTRSTTSGGGTTATSSSGGGTSTSTQSGGGSSQTSSGGGGSTQSSTSGGDHNHRLFTGTSFPPPIVGNQSFNFRLAGGGSVGVAIPIAKLTTDDIVTDTSSGSHSHNVSVPNHTHSVTIPAHSHSFSTPNHTHSVNIPNHSHDVTILNHTHEIDLPNHTHEIELPNHTHDVEHKIVELDTTPSKVTIKVDGNTVPFTSTSGDRINLMDYMNKDQDGKVSRGRHEVTVHPDGLARIEADLILRVFIQSQLGGSF